MIKKSTFSLTDQSGTALVIALVMMVILTVVALASSFTSIFEIKLSGNKRGTTDAFYAADAGLQAVSTNVTNFNLSGTTFVDIATADLPTDLQAKSINSVNSTPNIPFVSFSDPPTVKIYHTTETGAVKNRGYSATSFNFAYYIIDSVGKDQLDLSLMKSNARVREKVVRLLPTQQGGN